MAYKPALNLKQAGKGKYMLAFPLALTRRAIAHLAVAVPAPTWTVPMMKEDCKQLQSCSERRALQADVALSRWKPPAVLQVICNDRGSRASTAGHHSCAATSPYRGILSQCSTTQSCTWSGKIGAVQHRDGQSVSDVLATEANVAGVLQLTTYHENCPFIAQIGEE